jgi:methyl-accepting chemotaxis protein
MSAPSIHDAYYDRGRSSRSMQRSVDARSHIDQAAKHLDRAIESHGKHQHGHVLTAIQDAQACLQRAIGAAAPTSSQIANPSGKMGAQTSAGQSSRATTRAERQAEVRELAAMGRLHV